MKNLEKLPKTVSIKLSSEVVARIREKAVAEGRMFARQAELLLELGFAAEAKKSGRK